MEGEQYTQQTQEYQEGAEQIAEEVIEGVAEHGATMKVEDLQENGALESAEYLDVDGMMEDGDGEVSHDYDITHLKCFNDEIKRIEECKMIIFRGLTSLERESLEDEPEAKLLDICADLQAEEEALFSPIPVFVARILENERTRHEESLANIDAHEEVRQSRSVVNSRYSDEQRAFVDPGVPLSMPFSIERYRSQNRESSVQTGTYHDLFFGDGTGIVFEAPPDNKRRQLEDYRMTHPLPRGGVRRSYTPPRRKPMKVSHDFVPACANVDARRK